MLFQPKGQKHGHDCHRLRIDGFGAFCQKLGYHGLAEFNDALGSPKRLEQVFERIKSSDIDCKQSFLPEFIVGSRRPARAYSSKKAARFEGFSCLVQR